MAVTYSVRRVRADYGLPDKATRTVLARGVLPRTDLDPAQVLALRALVDADRIPAPSPAVAALRDETVLAAARSALDSPAPGTVLVITDTDARTARDLGALGALLELAGDRPVLLIPLGRWAAGTRR